MEPGSPSRMERLASGELASAFCGLTTSSSSSQLGQGQAPASLPGLPKRKPAGAQQLGGLQQLAQGSAVPQENALMLPWAKRRCVSSDDLPSFQLHGSLGRAQPAPATTRFAAAPAAAAYAPAAAYPTVPAGQQHAPHRYNLRSSGSSGLGVEHAAAFAAGPFPPATRRPAVAVPGPDRGHLVTAAAAAAAGGDSGHLLPARGGGYSRPTVAAGHAQPPERQHPQAFAHALPPRHPGPAAGRPLAANAPVPAARGQQRQQQLQWAHAAAAPAAVAAVAAAGAAAAAAGAVAAAASVSRGAADLAHMLHQPAAAQHGYAPPRPAASQPAATWPGAARTSAPMPIPVPVPRAAPAYPAPAIMSSAAHLALSDSQEAEWDTHAFSNASPGGSLDDDFDVLDDGSSSGSDFGELEEGREAAGGQAFHSARSHPSALRELPPEGERCAAKQQQQQQQIGFTSTATAATAEHSAAAAAPPSERKPSQRELELLLQAELRAANDAMCAASFPENCAFCPVHEADCMIPLCVAYNIPPISIVLGAAYFQRLLARCTDMRRYTRAEGFFVQVAAPGLNGKVEQVVMMRCPNTACDSLRVVYLACIYLGAKVGDRVPYSSQLSSMLKAAVGGRISSQQAAELEVNVLQGLEWRLGPYFDLSPDGGF